MTTKVTVDAHAGWPVRVVLVDQTVGVNQPMEQEFIVEPNTQQDFYVHSTRWLKVFEESRPEGS